MKSLNFQLQLVLYSADSRVGLHKTTETSDALLHWTSFSCIHNVKVNQTAASTYALSNELPKLVREFLYCVTAASRFQGPLLAFSLQLSLLENWGKEAKRVLGF